LPTIDKFAFLSALDSLNRVIARESGRSSNPQYLNASLGVTGCPAFAGMTPKWNELREESNVQRKHANEHRRRLRGPLAAFALVLAGCEHPTAAAEVMHFKVGISEPVNTVLALWMAQAGGFYAA